MPENTALTDPRQLAAYQSAVAEFDAAIKTAETDHITTIWKLGQLVLGFLKHADRGKYGAHGLQNLSDDLRERGRDLGVRDLTRYLYYAKQVAETFALDQIQEMVALGYSRTHARLLLSLTTDERETIQQRMLDANGRVVSTECTRQLIAEIRRETAGKTVTLISQADDDETEPESASSTQEPAAATPSAPMYVASEEGEGDGGPKEEAKPADKKEEKKPADKPKADQPKEKSEEVVIKGSPVKLAEKFDSKVTRLTSEMADFFILVRQTGKKGFDSDVVTQKWRQALMSAKSDLKTLGKTIAEILPHLDDEIGPDV